VLESYALSLLKSMLKIYSPTGSEHQLAKFLSGEMARLGFTVDIDAAGNVVGSLGEGPEVLMCGHMDTVRGRLPVKVREGRIYGRGSVDAKGPLAAIITAAKLYAQSRGSLKVVVAAVVDEEGYSRGVKHLISYLPKPICAFFGEPSNTYGITVGYKGALSADIIVKTQTGHVASSELYVNAAELAYEVWLKIKEEASRRSKPESRFHSLDAALTHVASKRRPGVLPDECSISVNLRLPPNMTCEETASLLQRWVAEAASPYPSAAAEAFIKDCVEAFQVAPTAPPVRALQRAIIKVLGRPPAILRKTGTGDVNVASSKWDIPMAVYGPGDSKLDHTPEENLAIQDYFDSIKVYAQALRELESLHRRVDQ